jgi:acyl dehydratase
MRSTDLYKANERIVIGTYEFTPERIMAFARKFDPQHFHIDADSARASVFGGLCASGWHTCAAWMSTFVAYTQSDANALVARNIEPPKFGPSPGFKHLKWFKPVFAGDVITYSFTPLDSRPSASKPGLYLNRSLCEGHNQKDEPVLRFESTVIEYE